MRRTTQALIQALVALVTEKRWAKITIQDLLDRADIGRSTFYTHYRGKEDLLFRSFERMLRMLDARMIDGGSRSPRLAPVRELFEHVRAAGRFHEALLRARMIDRLFHHGIEVCRETIERRLEALPSPARPTMPAPVLAQALSGALFSLLEWWLASGNPSSPEEMDRTFHRLAIGSE